jgi:hypothetical protein
VEHALRILNGYFLKVRETSMKQMSRFVSNTFLIEEKKAESDILVARPMGLELLEQAYKAAGKIIYISDTYFSAEELAQFLNDAGVPIYGKIFASSETHATKREGGLFKQIEESLGIDSSRWLHIGDDKLADNITPTQFGISTLLVPNRVEMLDGLLHVDHLEFLRKSRDLDSLLTFGIFAEHADTDHRFVNDQYFRLGMTTIGPLVTGFSGWINSEVKQNEKLTFLGRDGFLPQKVFKLLNQEKNCNNYMRVSRRKLLVPAWLGKRMKPLEFLKRIPSLPGEDSDEYVKRLGLAKQDMNYQQVETNTKLSELLLSESIIGNAIRELENMSDELNKLEESTTVVDVGWRATLQEALVILTDRPLKGLYLGTSGTTFIKKPNALGWLTNSGRPRSYGKVLRQSIGLIERSFSEQVASSDGRDANQFNFEIDEKIAAIQDGALEFAQSWIQLSNKYDVRLRERTAIAGLKAVMLSPEPIDLRVIGTIKNQHAPNLLIDESETLIPNIEKDLISLREIPTANECHANWPIGYERAVIYHLSENGVRPNRIQRSNWRLISYVRLVRNYGLINLLSLAVRKIR